MNPICQVDINRPECQQWMIKVHAKCRDLLSNNAPNEFSMWWLYDTPAVYKDLELMTPVDCHKLKRELVRNVSDYAVDGDFGMFKAVGVILAVAVLFLLLLCGMHWGSRTKAHADGPHPEPQGDPAEALHVKKKKKPSVKRCMRGSCRLCCLHSEAQMRSQELKTKNQVAVHIERSQRKMAQWTKARERYVRRQKEKLERGQETEYDRIQQIATN